MMDTRFAPADTLLTQERVVLPCAESCAAFRPLDPDRWSEFGLCTNPRSPFCGYPVRLGRNCRHFLTSRPAAH